MELGDALLCVSVVVDGPTCRGCGRGDVSRRRESRGGGRGHLTTEQSDQPHKVLCRKFLAP